MTSHHTDATFHPLSVRSLASRRRVLTLLGAAPLALGLLAHEVALPVMGKKAKKGKKGKKSKKGNQGNSSTPTPSGNTQPALTGETATLLQLINDFRKSEGVAVLTHEGRLDAAAQAHSEDMADRSFFAHTNPDGATPDTRIRASGYSYDAWGENIYQGGPAANEAFAWWQNSSAHRANMLSANFQEIGLGLAKDGDDRWLWTNVFASPTG